MNRKGLTTQMLVIILILIIALVAFIIFMASMSGSGYKFVDLGINKIWSIFD